MKTAWYAAAIVFLVHAAGNAHYGFFRDELYFIICGTHPQWGYVDQPPLIPLLAAMTQVFGHSLFALRLVPALFAAAGAFVTCELVVAFGGGAFAQLLATIVYLFTPVLLSFGMKVSTDEVNLLTWPLLALIVVRLSHGADPRLWLAAGAVAGITLESKYSVVFFMIALVIAMVLTPQRAMLRSPWFFAGVGMMALVALPNFLWQAHYGFPMLELLRNGQSGKNLIAGPALFIAQELIITNIFIAPIWLIGLWWLLKSKDVRFLGYTYIIVIALMILTHGKHYYPAAIYSVLIAAGVVPIEAWTRRRTGIRTVLAMCAIVAGLIFVPLALPVLSEATFVSYMDKLSDTLHISKSATATEHGRDSGTLPGDWADMHGWPEMAQTVAAIYDALPTSERSQAVVVASNYGEASAIAFFEPHVPVISGHNQWYLWGPRGYSGNVIVDVNGDCGKDAHLFERSQRADTFKSRWAIDYENDVPIMVCRGIRRPLPALWPLTKKYI